MSRHSERIPHHFGVKILNNSYTYVTKEANPDDEWDADDTETSHDINGMEIAEHGYHADVVLDFLPTKGQEYYLLYATHSTGDSFSHHTGNIFYIDLFNDLEFARKIQKLFESDNSKEGKNITYTRESGSIVQHHTPWGGYFEHLEYVNIEKIKLND